MNILGKLVDLARSIAEAYTERSQKKGPNAALDFEKEADRAQKAATARDVNALQRALKRKRVLGVHPAGKRKPPKGS